MTLKHIIGLILMLPVVSAIVGALLLVLWEGVAKNWDAIVFATLMSMTIYGAYLFFAG